MDTFTGFGRRRKTFPCYVPLTLASYQRQLTLKWLDLESSCEFASAQEEHGKAQIPTGTQRVDCQVLDKPLPAGSSHRWRRRESSLLGGRLEMQMDGGGYRCLLFLPGSPKPTFLTESRYSSSQRLLCSTFAVCFCFSTPGTGHLAFVLPSHLQWHGRAKEERLTPSLSKMGPR